MGATEVVHGVSASTMGLVLGVYNELISSFRHINSENLRHLRRGAFRATWRNINGNFLTATLSGIFAGLLLLTPIVSSLLQSHFVTVTSFLFGIILTSGILLLRHVKRWTLAPAISLLMGIVINYAFTILPPLATPDSAFFTIFTGFLTGFSLLLPGVSSAFILLLLGKYQFIVSSFARFEIGMISLFFLFALFGLWVASRFMYRMLADYYSATVALLAGLTLGALNKLWPWRVAFEYVFNTHGIQIPAYDKSVLPWHYVSLTGKDPQVFQAILMTALGVLIVVMTEKIAAGLKTKF